MPLRRLASRERSPRRNHALGALLAFTAGAADVSGFLALGEYTSHVTGATASFARGVSVMHEVLTPAAILFSFICGAALSSVLINFLARRGWESEFALPMLLEALLLSGLGVLASPAHRLASLCLLALTMGLQNAMITRLSNKEIRTTHVSAMATDIGIQLGRALYFNRRTDCEPVQVDRVHLLLLLTLVTCFFTGGVLGGFAYPHLGLHVLVVLAVIIGAPTVMPIAADLRAH